MCYLSSTILFRDILGQFSSERKAFTILTDNFGLTTGEFNFLIL